MQYEGKIYGNVGGKYIELDYPQDLKDFVKRLNEELDKRIKDANEKYEQYKALSMTTTSIASGAMETAYTISKQIVKELHPTP